MRLRDPAQLLAACRAVGLIDASGLGDNALEGAQRMAGACGRKLVRAHGPLPPPAATRGRPGAVRQVLTLGWSLPPVPEEEAAYMVRRLSTTQSLTFAACLAAAWRDARLPLYPGEPFMRAEIIDALVEIGADAKAVKDALDTELPLQLLIYNDGGLLRLGPAVAGLPATFAESMGRMHDRLPRPPQRGSGEGGGWQ